MIVGLLQRYGCPMDVQYRVEERPIGVQWLVEKRPLSVQ